MNRMKTELEKPVMRESKGLAEMLNSTQKSTRQITANFNAAMQTKVRSERDTSEATSARRSES